MLAARYSRPAAATNGFDSSISFAKPFGGIRMHLDEQRIEWVWAKNPLVGLGRAG